METITAFIVSLAALAGGLWGSTPATVTTAAEAPSVELGITELSPRGHEGGYAMPASDSSAVYDCGLRAYESLTDTTAQTSFTVGQTVIFRWAPDPQYASNNLTRSVATPPVEVDRAYEPVADLNSDLLPAGTYTYSLAFGNYSCAVTLTFTNPSRPDLDPLNFTNLGAARTVGTPTTLSIPVRNVGTASTPAGYTGQVRVYSGTGCTGTPVATLGTNTIAAGQGAGADRTLTSGSWTPGAAGTYSALAVADSGNAITELNEANNTSGCGSFSVAAPPPPTVTLTANPSTIAAGGSANLTWTVSGSVTSCTASGAWGGSKSVSGGSQSTGSLTNDSTYRIQCTGPGGTGNLASVLVDVIEAPNADLIVCPDDGRPCVGDGETLIVAQGDTITLDWTGTQNATACTAVSGSGFATGGSPSGTDGADVTQAPSATTKYRYEIECENAVGTTDSEWVDILVGNRCPATFSADQSLIRAGSSVTIEWQKPIDLLTCTVTGGTINETDTGEIDPVCDPPESRTTTLENRTTFTLTCEGGYTETATVDVIPRLEEI